MSHPLLHESKIRAHSPFESALVLAKFSSSCYLFHLDAHLGSRNPFVVAALCLRLPFRYDRRDAWLGMLDIYPCSSHCTDFFDHFGKAA